MHIKKESGLDRLVMDVVSYSKDHVHGGGIPFTAFVVDANGQVVGRGVNRVMEHHDPTAHAEVEAIRDACQNLSTPYLRGATLIASGEPCGMCYMNAVFSGISNVIFAADRDEAAKHGFDYRSSYDMLANFPDSWPFQVQKHQIEGALEPFKFFRAKRKFL